MKQFMYGLVTLSFGFLYADFHKGESLLSEPVKMLSMQEIEQGSDVGMQEAEGEDVAYYSYVRALLNQQPARHVEDSATVQEEDADTVRSPQVIGKSFNAVSYNDSAVALPQPTGDVGLTQVVVATRGKIKSFLKASGLPDGALNISLNTFFDTVRQGYTVVDPQVRYDRVNSRWFILGLNTANNNNRILIAVSTGNTITKNSSWRYFYLSTGKNCRYYGMNCGMDNQAIYIGGNAACSSDNSKVFVVQKNSLLNGTKARYTVFNNLIDPKTLQGMYFPVGVDNFDEDATYGYFIGVDNSSFGKLILHKVADPGSGWATISDQIVIDVSPTSLPILTPHKGNTRGVAGYLNSGNDRLVSAHVRDQMLWTAHTIGVTNQGDAVGQLASRNGVRWYSIDLACDDASLYQEGTLFHKSNLNLTTGLSYFNPSIMTSGQCHMALNSSVAGPNKYIDVALSGRFAGTPKNQLLPVTTSGNSAFAYNPSFDLGGDKGRAWGDCSRVCVDPVDNMTLWAIQECLLEGNSWGVVVKKLLAPPPIDQLTITPESFSCMDALPKTFTLEGVSKKGSGFYDGGDGAKRLKMSINSSMVYDNESQLIDLKDIYRLVNIVYESPTKITFDLYTNPLAGIVITTSSDAYGMYENWDSSQFKFDPQADIVELSFVSTLTHDLHVALSPVPGTNIPMYEIVLGGWDNTGCAIRRESQGEPVVWVDGSITSGDTYIITLDRTINLIRAEKIHEGVRSTLVEYLDVDFIPDVQYFAFSGWGEAAEIKDIDVLKGFSTTVSSDDEEGNPLEGITVAMGGGPEWSWDDRFVFDTTTTETIQFQFTATADDLWAVALSPTTSSNEHMYMIVLNNQTINPSGQSGLYYGANLLPLSGPFDHDGDISPAAVQPNDIIRITLNRISKTLYVEVRRDGNTVSGLVSTSHPDSFVPGPNYIPDVKYFGFYAGATSGEYKDIEILEGRGEISSNHCVDVSWDAELFIPFTITNPDGQSVTFNNLLKRAPLSPP